MERNENGGKMEKEKIVQQGLLFVNLVCLCGKKNACADWLAKKGSNCDSLLVTWPSCLVELAPLLLSDAMEWCT